MPVLDKEDSSMESLVDGMIALLKQNLVGHTVLIRNVAAGSTEIQVDNTLRFDRNDNICIFDNNAVFNQDENLATGMEYHQIKDFIVNSNTLVLTAPLEKDFFISDDARIQKTIKNTLIYAKDILYGDREVIPFDQVAITVEPERLTPEWMALRMMSDEFRMSINIYVKSAGSPEQVERNMRIRDAYATAIFNLLMQNIHLDLNLDEIPLRRNALMGENYVYINDSEAENWPVDLCPRYEIKDNFGTNQDLTVISCYSSSQSSLSSTDLSSTDYSSLSSSSISSKSSSSNSSSTSNTFSSISSISSSSSDEDDLHKVCLNHNLSRNYLLKDKAVLRRIIRYMYDSRVADIEYGTVQKGSAILKAARLTWWGKETRIYNFPQVGKGGDVK